MLRKNGGDLFSLTRYGLTSMHIAAQGDQPFMLALLKDLGMSFVERDYKGATPLHWAAYLGCEMATAVLISWNVQIDSVDNEGYTPLHLSAIAGNARITRQLMLKGASEDISDGKGRVPLDFANESGFTNIIGLLGRPSSLSLCGIKPPQRPIRYKRLLMLMFIALLATGIGCNLLILGIRDYGYITLAALQVCLFIIIVNKNPGFIENNENHTLLQLYQEFDSVQICPDCIVKRYPRSRHCQCCGKCVEKFDHHCPWVNNCIGAKNLGIFYIFILTTLGFLLCNGYYDSRYVLECYRTGGSDNIIGGFIAAIWACVSLAFIGPLFLLVMVQTRNILSNTTTNERFSRNPAVPAERNDSDGNVDRSSVCRNITSMCCNTHPLPEKSKNKRNEENSIRFTVIASDYEDSLSKSNSA